MEFDKLFNIYTLITLILGFILRDLYKWMKSKLIKGGNKPKIYVEFNCRITLSQGINPRIYHYESKLSLTNTDINTIYNVKIDFISEKWVNCFLNNITNEPFLVPSIIQNKKIELIGHKKVERNDNEDKEQQARTQLPGSFTNPKFKISFENYNGKKFSEIKEF